MWNSHHVLWVVVILSSLLGSCLANHTHTHSKRAADDLKIVCYYSNWAVYRPGLAKFTPQNINPYLCSHLIYAFAGLSSKFELKAFDPYNDINQGNYKKFVGLKAYNNQLKTLIAIGGWNEGSKRYSSIIRNNRICFMPFKISLNHCFCPL
jgi:chitinase